MADRNDPIADESANKRRKLNPNSSQKGWDSQDDSGEEFTAADFETAATLPLPESQKRKFGYTTEQMHEDLRSTPHARSSDSSGVQTTQPTQPLYRTQPTQPLPPRDNVQVERSSPIAPETQSQTQRALPQPIQRAPLSRPGGVLASAMAPAGTAFRRPVNAQPRPAPIDIDSDDDPPIQRSDDHTQGQSSNIRPTNFKRAGRGIDSSPNQVVRESPRPPAPPGPTGNMFDDLLSGFGYRPPAAPAAPKPIDDMAGSYGNTSRPPRPRQTGPARAMPVASLALTPRYQTLDDISDFELRRKVGEISNVMGPSCSIQNIMDALLKKKGNINDTMEHLAQLQDDEKPDPLSSMSPLQKKGVAKQVGSNWKLPLTASHYEDSPKPRPTAKQQVKVPAKSIAEKYRQTAVKDTKGVDVDEDEDEDEDEGIRQPRGRRLVQGRKPTVFSSPPSSPPRQVSTRPRTQKAHVIISDDEGSEDDSGFVEEDNTTTPVRRGAAVQAGVQELRDDRLLNLINEATAHDLAELSGQPEATIQFVLDQRPFVTLDDVRGVVQETLTKTGKKSKKIRALGDKLVDDCTEVMTGYDAIDELVVECEKIARPVQEALRGWGIGETVDGELQLMSLDEAHDSGIGTPSSSVPPEEDLTQKGVKNKPKGNFIGQPSNMSSDLLMKNYQLVGLNWLYLLFKKELSCILADDMGLGKTCQIIGFLSYLQIKQIDGVHLVIVPGSTLENWLREFQRFSPGLAVRPYYGLQAERAQLRYDLEEDRENIDVIVTTYDMAVAKEDNAFLRKFGPFSCCVYDEAHALRNPKSQRYQQLVRIEADFKVLLTGTPLQNNLQELIAILAFIMPDMFQHKRDDLEYIFKHKASTKDTASAALLSSERIARARTMMTPFILRRKKQQVLDLPAKHTRVEYCDMTDDQSNYYADLLDEAQSFYANNTKVQAKQSSNLIMSLRKAAIHPLMARRLYDDKRIDRIVSALRKTVEFETNPTDKIRAYLVGDAAQTVKGGDFGLHKFCNERDALRKKFALKHREWMDSGKVKKFSELVTKYQKNGDRVLVFSQFTTLMDILEAVLEELDVKFMRLDGSTKMDTRQDMIDQFYEDKSITVFMLSTRAGGAGINLAAANKVIIFDSGFNPQDDIQAENRAHRVGQTREVEVVRLVTKGTIEEQIHALGASKLALDERVAGEGASAADEKQAEKAGEQMVEKMFLNKLKGEDSIKKEEDIKKEEKADPAPTANVSGVDLKDAFKKGLEGEGLKVESKQAQY